MQVQLIEVASGRDRVRQGVQRDAGEPALLRAHRSSDEIHQQQRALRGVARTKLAFTSDRDGERMKGRSRSRDISEHLHLRLRRREPDAGDDHRGR